MTREFAKYPGLNLGSAHGSDHEAAEALIFGFWVFLMSDGILFGMMFATYVDALGATAEGPGPAQLYDIRSAFYETLLLLASSFTFGLASLAMKRRNATKQLAAWLVLTLFLGAGFLVFEAHDFGTMFSKGGVPSRSGFLSAFFDLVPLHGLHVIGACVWMLCLLGQLALYGEDTKTKLGIMRLALFWHFLDIIWIAIVSVVYLGGLA